MADEAEKTIKTEDAQIAIEVLAEVVYVLKGVYKIEREAITFSLLDFLSEVQITDSQVARLGLVQ